MRYFYTVTVVGELYFGAQKSQHAEKNLRKIDEFIEVSTVLECSVETTRHYGIIKDSLKCKGHPIPENDIWIAALAREYSLTLVSKDEHFKYVDSIELKQW